MENPHPLCQMPSHANVVSWFGFKGAPTSSSTPMHQILFRTEIFHWPFLGLWTIFVTSLNLKLNNFWNLFTNWFIFPPFRLVWSFSWHFSHPFMPNVHNFFLAQASNCIECPLKISAQICAKHVDESVYFFQSGAQHSKAYSPEVPVSFYISIERSSIHWMLHSIVHLRRTCTEMFGMIVHLHRMCAENFGARTNLHRTCCWNLVFFPVRGGGNNPLVVCQNIGIMLGREWQFSCHLPVMLDMSMHRDFGKGSEHYLALQMVTL